MAEAGVGPEEEEEVGKAGNGDAEVGFSTLAPAVLELAPLSADDGEVVVGIGDVEAGAVDDGVDLVLLTVTGHHGVLAHLGDTAGVDLDVRPVEGRVVVAGEQDALAAHRVIGCDDLAQLRIRDRLPDVALGQPLGGLAEALVEHCEEPGLEGPVHRDAGGALHQRNPAEHLLDRFRDRAIGLGLDPRGRALEQVQLGRLLGHAGHELDRAGPGSDDSDALAPEVVVVVPLRRVEDLALEVLHARELGITRDVQSTDAGHQGPADVLGSVAGRDQPRLALLVVLGAGELHAVVHVVADLVLVRAVAQVVVDLALLGEQPRPVRVLLERERVHQRGHVAGASGVGVVPPGSAEVAVLLQHDEVIDTGLLELDRHAETGEAGSDDDHRSLVSTLVRRLPLHHQSPSSDTGTQSTPE